MELNLKKLTVLLTTLLSFNAFSATELKGSPEELKKFLHPDENIITITRAAEEVAFKDIAIVSLLATTEDDDLAVALNKNAKLRNQISAVLTQSGIPQDNINNSKFSTSPDYGWFGDKPDSYKVSNRISIRISDESGLENIAKVVDKHKEITLLNTEYEHSKKDEFIAKVKNKALDKVLKEREFYSKKLGIKLIPISFKDGNFSHQNDIEMIQVTGFRASSSNDSYSSKSRKRANTSFEKLIYKAKVSVSFKVK